MKYFSRARTFYLPGLLLAVLTACGPSVELPPVVDAPTGQYHPGKFVWHNLITSDITMAKRFYRDLLGWQFEDYGIGKDAYAVAIVNGKPIAGLFPMPASASDVPSQWIGLVSVTDVNAAADMFKNNGGRVIAKPVDVPNHGRIALAVDPQGAAIGLIRSTAGDPADDGNSPALNTWLWDELWASDPGQSASFYRDIAGYEMTETKSDNIPYWVFESGGAKRAGMLRNPSSNTGPVWLPYIRVADAKAGTAKAESLGGKVVLAPTPEVRNGTVGIVMDPTGSLFVLQEWDR